MAISIGEVSSSFDSGTKCEIVALRPAIILYPSFLTPEIVVGNDDLELILLGRSDMGLTADNINVQLKCVEGLGPDKFFDNKPLFSGPSLENIALNRALIQQKSYDWTTTKYIEACINIYSQKFPDPDPKNAIISTESRFSGIFDQRFLDLFSKDSPLSKFDSLYIVSIDNSIIRGKRISNLFWLYPADGNLPPLDQNSQGNLKNNELQDGIIHKVMKELKCDTLDSVRAYKAHFTRRGGDDDTIKWAEPIQSYHPVYYFKDVSQMNIGHLADFHLNSRQRFLSKSKARVIPCPPDPRKVAGVDELKLIPELGPAANNCFKNVYDLLKNYANDNNINILLMGGDIIDYIHSLDPMMGCSERPDAVWDAVSIDSDYKDYDKRAIDYIDFGTFYFLMLKFCRKKPAFVVSGNHDVYYNPYGISPRLATIRANSGIPADHNLTIYEAILIYGGTYAENGGGAFKPDKFKWFYSILTPFSDFAASLPKQSIVGLGWGDNEDKVGINDWQEAWYGHLPRADESISEKQNKLLDSAKKKVKEGEKIILLSHFTFISYLANEPTEKKEAGVIELKKSFGNFDSGTFEESRDAVYGALTHHDEQKIRYILTGHSHRRGLYSMGELDIKGGYLTATTHIHDIEEKTKAELKDINPAIIVSDCAGPIPRCNKKGELVGWGSDQASGTKLIFTEDGEIDKVEIKRVGRKPRFVVAVDYIDLVTGQKVIEEFVGDEIGNDMIFNLNLNSVVSPWAKVEKIILYAKYKNNGADPWERIILTNLDGSGNVWKISGQDIYTFKMFAEDRKFVDNWNNLAGNWKTGWEGRHGKPSVFQGTEYVDKGAKIRVERVDSNLEKKFIAMKFEGIDKLIKSKYDFDSAWCFPISSAVTSPGGRGLQYELYRDRNNATEIPELWWYKQQFK